jgi:hypothetical protein
MAEAFSIAAWLRGRPAYWIFPSDLFFIACILIFGTVPFINLYATSPLFANSHYTDAAVQRALISLILMFLTMGIVWMLRPKIVVGDPMDSAGSWREGREDSTLMLWVGAICMIGLSVLLMVVYEPFRAYKSDVLTFLTGNISADDYRNARRVSYADDFIIVGLMGRLRFGVFPMLFAALSILTVRRFGIAIGFGIAAVAFVIGPASMSKAPIVFYFVYFSLTVILLRNVRWPFKARNAILTIVIALTALLLLLSGIYYLQYQNIFNGVGALPDALSLAYFRLLTAPYDSLLKYMTAFPGGDVGIGGSIITSIFGGQIRNLDVEVAIHFLGPTIGPFTSFPTIFIGKAYASFGYVGVVVYSALVSTLMLVIDKILTKIESRELKIIFCATMMMNVTFFTSTAALTAFLTYGTGIMPLLLLAADRASRRRRRRGGANLRSPRAQRVDRPARRMGDETNEFSTR